MQLSGNHDFLKEKPYTFQKCSTYINHLCAQPYIPYSMKTAGMFAHFVVANRF